MADFRWLWLDQAAGLIADRLAEAKPDQFPSPASALDEARNQLLDQAFIGTLQIEGEPDDPDKREHRPSADNWVAVHSSFWDPTYRPATGFSIICLQLVWQNNCFSYEEEGICFGYVRLRVQAAAIDRIWPHQAAADSDNIRQPTAPISSSKSSTQRDPGGAPRKYRDDLFIEIIRWADNSPHQVQEKKAELFQHLRNLHLTHWGPNESPSDSTIREVLNKVCDRLYGHAP
jgi:hypothetical protein